MNYLEEYIRDVEECGRTIKREAIYGLIYLGLLSLAFYNLDRKLDSIFSKVESRLQVSEELDKSRSGR